MAPPLATPPLRLESHWRVRAVRHPSLRLLACVAHALATFFVCSSSPLNASLLAPARVPVVTHWVAVTLAPGASLERTAFHVALSVSLLLLLRLVAYRSLVQRAWNWHNELSTASRALSRLEQRDCHGAESAPAPAPAPAPATSSVQAPRDDGKDTETGDTTTRALSLDPIELHTHAVVSVDASQRTARVPLANADARTQGSWTFVVGCYPLAWSLVVSLLERLTHGSAFFDAVLQARRSSSGSSSGSGNDAMVQLRAQSVLYQALMALSVLKLLATADQVLQDTHYSRAFFYNWGVRVRRAYVTYPVVRLVICWLALAALVVGGVYLQGFARLQTAWLALNLSSASAAWTRPLFSNEAWNALLAAAAVALDVLWIVQDAGFPGFASPAGVRLFGLPVETLRVSVGRGRHHAVASVVSSKWLAGFVVLGLLLPLESCHFVQLLTYTPASYDQYVDAASHRVRPLVALSRTSTAHVPADATPTEALLLAQGAISRYFGWSAWERLPALGLVVLALGCAVWLSHQERVTVRYTHRRTSASGSAADGASACVRLSGTSSTSSSSSRVVERLPPTTKRTLAAQQRLQQLYALRTRADTACLVLATLSVVTVVAQLRSIWRSEPRREATTETSLRPLQAPGEAYGVLLALLTLALAVQIVERYRVKMTLLVLRGDLPRPSTGGDRLQLHMFPRTLLGPLALELLLCCACLPPFVHSRVAWHETRFVRSSALSASPLSSSCPSRLTLLASETGSGSASGETTCGLDYAYPLEVVNLVVLVRLYWLVRWPRNRLAATVGYVRRHAAVPLDSLRWSFRVVFTLAPTQLLVALFVSLWVATAAAVAILERPVPSLLETEEHALWLTIVTMSTVGYGDAYPLTALGRAATFVGAVVGGAVLVSLLTSVFLETLTGSRAEHKVLGTIERAQWQQRMRHASAVLIASAWVWHCCRRHRQDRSRSQASSSHCAAAEQRLFSAAYQFKRLRKERPKATLESLDALKVGAVAHWRTHALREWVAGVHAASQASLDALDRELDALEQALVRVL